MKKLSMSMDKYGFEYKVGVHDKKSIHYSTPSF